MKWFDGAIPAAIAESRQRNGVFVVVVFQKQDSIEPESKNMEAYWTDVDGEAFAYPIVAVKVFDGTSTKEHFSQLYPVPVVPSAYLIDPNGRPLDVITLTNAPDQSAFNTRLDNAMKKMATLFSTVKVAQLPSSITSTSGGETDISSIADAAPSSSNPEIPSASIAFQSISNSSVALNSVGDNVVGETSASSRTLEERVKRAQDLLTQKRVEEEKQRREEEKRKETERRNIGKLMAEAKANRDEMEIRALAEQRRRDKLENEKELKRLREQIKADREERMNRTGKVPGPATTVPQAETCCTLVHRDKVPQTGCRIQVKFPNGGMLLLSFQPTDVFSMLVHRIEVDGRQGKDFILTQNYPRRNFGTEDYNSTFAELGLTPSATILVFSNRRGDNVCSTTGFFGFPNILYYIVIPFQTVVQYILSFIWPNQNRSKIEADNESKKPVENTRQEGNIHRFRNQEDSPHDSDDEARWNGNSTQQL